MNSYLFGDGQGGRPGASALGGDRNLFFELINEAVELAKIFGAEQGHRDVNGVLDKAARALRPLETAARR